MRRLVVLVFCALGSVIAGHAGAQATPLLQTPALSQTRIAFAWAGSIWTLPREGGVATGLVRNAVGARHPVFSPDGAWIAYTARTDGNDDVYIVPAAGGEPRRLTWHPGTDEAVGWAPDGKRVLISSTREAENDSAKLYLVPLSGGLPEALPLPRAEDGALSPDGSQIAYSPDFQWEPDWRNYRGGQTARIWIARLADSSIVKVPRDNSNDRNPMWVGNQVYFLSDRDGADTLYRYDPANGQVTALVDNHGGAPIDGASAGPGGIVYSQMGSLHLYDFATGSSHAVNVAVGADLPQARPRYENVGKHIENFAISPTGARAVFEAHGEIFTVPAEKGDVRDLTRTPGAAERSPAWSPDGKSIAYFSDASGEYALHIRAQDGLGAERTITLGTPPSFFYDPLWSPDSKKIAYRDKRLNLWTLDLANGKPVLVDTDRFQNPLHQLDPSWSPDSRWLAYTKQLPNHLRAVFVHSLASGKTTQVTDGMSDCQFANFDKNGKYLYFTASTDTGLTTGWLDMTSEAHPVTRNVYVAVLRKGLPSPLAPESDEDKGAQADTAGSDKKDDGKGKKADDVTIDFDGIGQRTLALPIPAANYVELRAGKSGELFLLEVPPTGGREQDGEDNSPATLQKFDLAKRKLDKFAEHIDSFALSFDGDKFLYSRGEDWFIAKTDAAPKADEGKIATDRMQAYVDPRAEWAQMYHETWRIERDFFYDPHHHGLDIAAAEQHFSPFLAGVGDRSDLTFLFRKMLAYLSAGHVFVHGGYSPETPKIDVGLLGADYTIANGRYRFARIYDGENWNPDLHAPLTQPGVDVRAGEYLLAVNDRELHAGDEIYSFFQQTTDKQVVLRVGPNPDGKGARLVTVVPVKDEKGLRHLAWVEDNRRKVDALSGGKLAYVHLPNTAEGGFTSFNRYYFAQTDKIGAVIDERYNHGGQLADYIIDLLRRPPMARLMAREGETYTEPTQAIFGPKALLINQFSGSGGDALPWYFKRAGIGPLVGTRTWGGLIGIGGYPPLIDGGTVTAPHWAIFGTQGQWEVENIGIAPDIEVEQDPALVRQGHDPQLERAVAYLMDALQKHPPQTFPVPAYPDFHPVLPAVPAP